MGNGKQNLAQDTVGLSDQITQEISMSMGAQSGISKEDRVQKHLQEERQISGEKAPSEVAQALADSSEFESEGEPQGFVGRYLKKHKDMKMKAKQLVQQEEEEKRQAIQEEQRRQDELKRQEEEAKKAEVAAVAAAATGRASIKAAPAKKKLTLLERAQQKIEQEEQKKMEAESVITNTQFALIKTDTAGPLIAIGLEE